MKSKIRSCLEKQPEDDENDTEDDQYEQSVEVRVNFLDIDEEAKSANMMDVSQVDENVISRSTSIEWNSWEYDVNVMDSVDSVFHV